MISFEIEPTGHDVAEGVTALKTRRDKSQSSTQCSLDA